MKNNRRRLLLAGGLACLGLGPVQAESSTESLAEFRERGRLRIAVYNDFLPFSDKGQRGIDVELARALAGKLGLAAEIVGFNADEDMNDDLRNMVWKGHYLGTQPADVMMHVPVDEGLAKANDRVRIFGAYYREGLALARNPARVPAVSGSAAVALEVFTREKIGVETASLADSFLLAVLNGRLQDNIVHFTTTEQAAVALAGGQVAAVLGPRSELEMALAARSGWPIETPQLPELKVNSWPLGMAVKVQEAELAAALGRALAELQQDGTVAAIFKRHGISHLPA